MVIDVTVTTCSSLLPFSSCKLGPEWDRVEKDLYLGQSWFSEGYVQVRRKKEEDLVEGDHVVLDVKVRRRDPGKAGGEKEADAQAGTWEARPQGLWLQRSKKRHASDSHRTVTAVDVLFGADAIDPRPSWEVKDPGLLLDLDKRAAEPRLSVRRGQPKAAPAKPQPRVRKDGRFKVIQVSDLHLSTGPGHCREPVLPADAPKGPCEADPRTLEFVREVLDAERPDLAVLSGDLVNGETAPDAPTALFKAAEPFIARNIPYAIIFGNHDDEGSLSRQGLMSLAEMLPGSLAMAGPATVDGVGNYVVEVLAASGTSHHSALTLYLLDTHSYSPDEAHFKGYDWLHGNQLAWFRETSRKLRHSEEHKGYSRMHMDMAFIHIPLPEYRGKAAPGTGEMREKPTAPGFNSGFKDALVEAGVLAVSAGHDHANDACLVSRHSAPDKPPEELGQDEKGRAKDGKVWMCYAGGSGYGGYGGYGEYKRRVRLWDFDMNESRIETWKRIDGEEGRKDVKKIVEGGRALG